MKIKKIVNQYLVVDDHNLDRKLAYSEVGNRDSDQLLLCIPGILEKRETFSPLLEKISHSDFSLRTVSLDLCGRGDSDPMKDPRDYKMSRYLADIERVLRELISNHNNPAVEVNILGTSMGGILGMYLSTSPAIKVSNLILNDIGFSLSWWSIYKLYGVMTKTSAPSFSGLPTFGNFQGNGAIDVAEMAINLGVSKEVIKAVQEPSHFDLPYKSDFLGMRFLDVIKPFKGSVSLIHGQDSPICTALQVNEFLKFYPTGNLLLVPGAEHPAPFNELVCDFIISKIPNTQSSKLIDEIKPNISSGGFILVGDGDTATTTTTTTTTLATPVSESSELTPLLETPTSPKTLNSQPNKIKSADSTSHINTFVQQVPLLGLDYSAPAAHVPVPVPPQASDAAGSLIQSDPASQDIQKHLVSMPTQEVIQNEKGTNDSPYPITSLGIISKLRSSFFKFIGSKFK